MDRGVPLAVGCDDLFVMHDAWCQAAWLAPPDVLERIDTRLWWAYRRAGKAMLVTTLTDVGAFLSSLLCVVPNLVSFAIFTSLLAVANLALVLTLWPCALLLHHRLSRCCARCCACCCACCCRRSQTADAPRITRNTSSTSDVPSDGASVVGSPDLPSTVGSTAGSPELLSTAVSAVPGAAGSAMTGLPAAIATPASPSSASAPKRHTKPRLVEWWYKERYVPWLRRGRTAPCLVITFGVAAAALFPFVLRLEGPKYDVMIWPAWHNNYRYSMLQDRHFYVDHPRLQLLWGTRGVDRSGCNTWDEEDLGTVQWDETFDLADPLAQSALLRACTQPLDDASLMVRGADGGGVSANDHLCVMRALSAWAAERNRTFPLPRHEFNPALLDFLTVQPQWLASLSFGATAGGGWRVRHVAISFTLSVEPHAPASRRRRLYNSWQQLLDELNDAAPVTAKHASQSAAQLWIVMALQELLVTYAFGVVLCSVLVGFCFVLVATRSIVLAGLCTLTISTIVVAWAGLLLACGAFDQGLGFVESLVLMISVGLMLDPLTHVAFAYSEAAGTRDERLAEALSVIGISVLAGCISTAGACAIMVLATIVVFSRFAMLFCSLMGVTLIYANIFLAPLLLLLGPVGNARTDGRPSEGSASSLLARASWRSWRRPRRAMSSSDAAGQTSPASVASHDEVELWERRQERSP